jgi:hypothetical protein
MNYWLSCSYLWQLLVLFFSNPNYPISLSATILLCQQQYSKLLTVTLSVPLDFRKIFVAVTGLYRLVPIQGHCYAIHAVVLRWL